MIEGNEIALRHALALEQEPAAHELQHLAAQNVAQRPELFVTDESGVLEPRPELGCVDVARPVIAQPAPPEPAHGSLHPTQQMDAVGDVPDRHFLGPRGLEQRFPHVAADLTVQLAHSVGGPCQAQGQDRHTERLRGILGPHPAQAHELLVGQLQV